MQDEDEEQWAAVAWTLAVSFQGNSNFLGDVATNVTNWEEIILNRFAKMLAKIDCTFCWLVDYMCNNGSIVFNNFPFHLIKDVGY